MRSSGSWENRIVLLPLSVYRLSSWFLLGYVLEVVQLSQIHSLPYHTSWFSWEAHLSGHQWPLVSSYVWLTGSIKCGSKDKACEVRILMCILGCFPARSPQLLCDPLLKGHASVGQASPGQLFSLDLRETPSLAKSGLRWEKSRHSQCRHPQGTTLSLVSFPEPCHTLVRIPFLSFPQVQSLIYRLQRPWLTQGGTLFSWLHIFLCKDFHLPSPCRPNPAHCLFLYSRELRMVLGVF